MSPLGVLDPYELRGPEFLLVYLFATILAAALAFWLRHRLRGPASAPSAPLPALSVLETALLAGGARRAFDAAVVRLATAGLLEVDATGRTLCPRGTSRGADALERAVLAAAGPPPGRPIDQARSLALASSAMGVAEARLRSLGLRPEGAGARLAPAAVMVVVSLFGAGKVLVGLSRQRPVGLLVALIFLTMAVALAFALAPPARSARGESTLRRLARGNDGLRAVSPETSPADAALGVALFDLAVLSASPLSSVALALRPSPQGANGSGCSSSGCSSSGCGGGCGGGGCGGCGS